MRKAAHNILAWAGLAIAGVFLLLDAGSVIPQRMTEGGGPFRALVFWLSYFPVWAVALIMLVWFATAAERKRLRLLTGPTARTLVAGNALLLMLSYPLSLLEQTGLPGNVIAISMFGLQVLVPLLFLIWWITGTHPARLRWSRAGLMLLYPLGYLFWVFMRGISISRWPYPFTNPEVQGWAGYGLSCLVILAVFGLIYLAMIAASRALNTRAREAYSSQHGLHPRR